MKKYQLRNHDKIFARIKISSNYRYKKDINYRLNCKTRCKLRQALVGKTKSSSTKEILGIDNDSYKKWTEFQFTPEMNWDNTEIDHVKSICMFDVSKDEELKKQLLGKKHSRY